jgi:hypothetical protein
METQPSQQFPNSLDGIQFRAVGREKVQSKMRTVILKKVGEHTGMMISCIIEYDHYTTRFTAVAIQFSQKEFKGFRVEYR